MPVLRLYLLNMILMTNVMKVHIWNNNFMPWQQYQNSTALPVLIFFYWPEKWFVTGDSQRLVKAKIFVGFFFCLLDL